MISQLEAEVALAERHLEILQCVLDNQPIGIVSLANETDYPRHKVRYSLRKLEEAGLIDPTSNGAVGTSAVEEFVSSFDDRIDELTDQLTGVKSDAPVSRLA